MKQTISYFLPVRAGRSNLSVLAFTACAFLAPTIVSASPIVGNLVLSGHTTQVFAVNATQIDFDFTGGVSNGFPPVATSGTVDGNGDAALFDIGSASTLSFAGLIGTTVTVHDLDAALEPVGATSGPSLPLANFITFGAQPGWSIALTQLLPGSFGTAGCSGPAAPGQICSLPNSPFNLSNLAGNQVSVSFSFLGTANDGQGNVTQISGNFGTTFSNTTLQAILAAVQEGKTVVTSGSGTLAATAATPEPGSIFLCLTGLTLLGGATIIRKIQPAR